MNRRTILITIAALAILLNVFFGLFVFLKDEKTAVVVTKPKAQEQYIGKVQVTQQEPNFSIRLLVLKHCLESMADGDARMAITAANLAKSKGLRIKDIGNHHVNRDGQIRRVSIDTKEIVWGQKFYIDQFREFVTQQMKVDAEPGDTLVVFTIGHGARSGHLDMMGQRRDVMTALAKASEDNDQEVLWWQLSCHAAAYLPEISSLNAKQQELFSIVASSTAEQESPAYQEGKYMEKLFVAMAEGSNTIDPDKDGTVTCGELKGFMRTQISPTRGRLVFAKSDAEPIFGLFSLANRIPIVDRNGQQGKYPRNYIPMPRRNK